MRGSSDSGCKWQDGVMVLPVGRQYRRSPAASAGRSAAQKRPPQQTSSCHACTALQGQGGRHRQYRLMSRRRLMLM